ncbi:MAG: 3-hydroxy-2-methylbutyryl-CoA dehydrogenase [Legionellales bacterium RIFCSPHIGHO2_12_FULL_35_11]|nr:MAG: 3-hydroxy-2-methylbutyryl-CoA dehydrogenase [Legionellales bacterium RIFCSPHIGHO2_12_FULL_35_11]
MDLRKQVAVITGGSSGMGQACAYYLSNLGVETVIWDINIENVAFSAFNCDVSSSESVTHALANTIEKVGTPRICINCAGIAPGKRMVGKDGAMPLSDFQKVININLVGTFNVMRLVTEAMLKLEVIPHSDERGVIINTASIAAYEGQIGQMAYSASKGGVVSMTLPAARELAKHGIRVNTIAPGLIATPMLKGMPAEVQESLVASSVYPKRLGYPEEFAKLAAHIIENQFINGEVIRLDGAVRLAPR